MTRCETRGHVMSHLLRKRKKGVENVSEDRIVHIVDDDAFVRHSMEDSLEDAGLQTQCHNSAYDFLNSFERESAGCVIADVGMPKMSGIDLLAELQRTTKRVPVIVIAGQADVALAVHAMKKGAFDFLEKRFLPDSLLAAVRNALGRGDAARGAARSKSAMLSEREKEVFDRLVMGKSNKIIASELNISERTVENHRASIRRKLGVRSLAELVQLAISAE